MTKKLFTLTVALLLFCAPCFLGCEPTENNIENPSQSSRTNELLEAVTVDWKGEKVTVGYSFEPKTSWDLVDWYKFDLVFKNNHVRIKMPNGKYMYMKADGSLLNNEGKGYIYGENFEENGTVLVKMQEDLWSRIDTSGSVVSEEKAPAGAIQYYLQENRYWYVDKGTNLWGLCDENQTHITEAMFKYIYEFVDGVAIACLSNDKQVLIDLNGSIRVEIPEDVEAVALLGDGLAEYNFGDSNNNSYRKLYDINGNCLCEEEFDCIGNFYDGLALIIKDNKIGFIDKEGTVVLQPSFQYDKVSVDTGVGSVHYVPEFIDENRIIVPINGKIGILQINRA